MPLFSRHFGFARLPEGDAAFFRGGEECKSGQTHSTVLRSTRASLTRLLAIARLLGLIR